MKFFDFEIMGLKRKLPYVQVGENLALASFVVLSDTELIRTVAPELLKRLPEVDVLMTAEAKGICLTYELSRLMGMKDFVVARKSRKPYMQNPVSHSVRSVTTQKEQHLWLDGCEAEKLKGKRVALIDDVIATGESLEALETLAKSAGANIVARAAILAELESSAYSPPRRFPACRRPFPFSDVPPGIGSPRSGEPCFAAAVLAYRVLLVNNPPTASR